MNTCVSLASGREVVKNLQKDKYQVYPVVISQNDNKWFSIWK